MRHYEYHLIDSRTWWLIISKQPFVLYLSRSIKLSVEQQGICHTVCVLFCRWCFFCFILFCLREFCYYLPTWPMRRLCCQKRFFFFFAVTLWGLASHLGTRDLYPHNPQYIHSSVSPPQLNLLAICLPQIIMNIITCPCRCTDVWGQWNKDTHAHTRTHAIHAQPSLSHF